MDNRTSFDEQMKAVREAITKTPDNETLWDVFDTLGQLSLISEELKKEEPNLDRVANPLILLFGGN